MSHHLLDYPRHGRVGGTKPKVGEDRQFVERVFGVVVALERVTWPPLESIDEALHLRMLQHGLAGIFHLRVAFRVV
jgi:hypothetical protein